VKSRLAIARATVEAEALLKSVVTDTPHIEPVPAPESHEPVASVSREEAYRQRRLLTPRLRWKILQRDDFRCLSCGADAAGDRSVRLDVDHIVAIANGGKTVPENLRTLCSRCNNGKGDLIM
jgi:5-methylcytosine-specific restriction endonuclease McrA